MANNERDDLSFINKIGFLSRFFIGISYYCPFSFVKVVIYRILGAKIGKGVFFGPGTMIISPNYSKVIIDDGVFISPGVMIKINTLSIGEKAHIGYQCLFTGEFLSIGKRCNISNRSFIEAEYAPIKIGDDVTIAASVIISSHDGSYKQTRGLEMKVGIIRIMNHAFIGNHATILPGVIIGERSIVGSGAVVTKDVVEDTVVVGVPAKMI